MWDDPKSEDRDSNTRDTTGAHIVDTRPTEKSTAASKGASIGTHVLETNVQSPRPSRTIEEILGAHPMNDDDFWGSTNPSDVSIDTTNSKGMMTGSHIIKLHTHKYEEQVPTELLNKVPNVPQLCDLAQKYQLDPSDKSKDSNMLLKTNNVTYTKDINLLSQENQDCYNWHNQQVVTRKHDGGREYYNQSDQQCIAYKRNGGLGRDTIELAPNSILEEEKEGFTSGLTSMIWGIIAPTHLWKEKRWGAPTHLMLTTMYSTLPKTNITGNQRQELWVKYLHHITNRIFTSANVNHKYRTFEANY